LTVPEKHKVVTNSPWLLSGSGVVRFGPVRVLPL
jgi:hypothetical protein